MTYESERRRMWPVLQKVRRLNIESHPTPHAIFDPSLAGFNLWCTPDDHPQGWDDVAMDAGAFAKPCEYVGTATWGWTGETITHIRLTTDAYALSDRDRGERHASEYHNRPEDTCWAAAKVAWLFSLAGVECPPIKGVDDDEESLPEIAEAKRKAEKSYTCPHCGSRVRVVPVYFQSERRILLTCENSGACNFHEL